MVAWAGYYGWLRAPQRRDKNSTVSWIEIHGDDAWHPEPESPELASHWVKCGRFSAGSNGIIPILWSELNAYNQCMGNPLSSAELDCLRQMSVNYCHWYERTQTDWNGDPPMLPDDQETIDRIVQANSNYFKFKAR